MPKHMNDPVGISAYLELVKLVAILLRSFQGFICGFFVVTHEDDVTDVETSQHYEEDEGKDHYKYFRNVLEKHCPIHIELTLLHNNFLCDYHAHAT